MITYKKGSYQIIISGKEVDLEAPIWYATEYKHLVLVTVSPTYSNRNVFAFDHNGNLLWIIDERPFQSPFHDEVSGYNGTANYNGKIVALSYIDFVIDELTGKILEQLPFSK